MCFRCQMETGFGKPVPVLAARKEQDTKGLMMGKGIGSSFYRFLTQGVMQ